MSDTLTRTHTELDVLTEAVEALREAEELRKAVRVSDARLRALCRLWDQTAGLWGTAPYHLEQSCRARGLIT